MLQIRCQLHRGAFALDVDVELPSPGVTALFGRSGAGKSTLVAILAGLLEPDAGRIVLDGHVLFDSAGRVSVPAHDRAVGCVFQDARLFPHYSVRGNLSYGLHRARQRETRIPFAQVVELLGLQELLDRPVFRLSGGERQRVALGRALLSQPRLLLLDEPLASLDAARKEELLPYFERLRDELQLPILHVTHAFDEVLRIAQYVMLLEDGTVGVSAPLEEACRASALHAITGSEVAGAVLEGHVRENAAADGLTLVDCGEMQIRVARLHALAGAAVRLFVAADDVAVARERPMAISTRNVLAARIERLDIQGDSVVLHLQLGSQHLLSRITRNALGDLGLASGSECFALFKAVATHGRRFARPGTAQ